MGTKAKPSKPVLVVRPMRKNDAFLELLNRAQIVFSHTPVMRIQPVTESAAEFEQIRDLILGFAQFDQAIFVSANAAQMAIRWLDEYWPVLPVKMAFFAVGQQTKKVLSDYGCTVQCPSGQQSTEGLLALPQLQNLHNQSVVIFRGSDGRSTLADTLIKRGAEVVYCELYRRVIDAQKLIEARAQMDSAGCLVVHSGELLQAMGEPRASNMPLLVPSDRVAAMARQLGYSHIQVAENALPASMFKGLQQLLNSG